MQFEESENRLIKQQQSSQQSLLEHQQKVGELQMEFMRDAEATSSQIEVMSCRILAMSEENCSLKGKLKDDSDSCSDVSSRLGSGLGQGEEQTGQGLGVRDRVDGRQQPQPVTDSDGTEVSRGISGYDADVERIRAKRMVSKPVVIDISYMSTITSSSSSPTKANRGEFSPGRQDEGESRKWLKEREVDGAVEGSVYDNVNRASLIIEAIRAASTDISVSGLGQTTAAPLSSSVTIDRRSLMKAVTALSDDMYAIQLQVRSQSILSSF